jgi:hypothetical protein
MHHEIKHSKTFSHGIIPDGRSPIGRKIILENMICHANRIENSKYEVDCHLFPLKPHSNRSSCVRMHITVQYVLSSFVLNFIRKPVRPSSATLIKGKSKQEQFLMFVNVLFIFLNRKEHFNRIFNMQRRIKEFGKLNGLFI